MSYGEASIHELLHEYKEMVEESEEALGIEVYHISNKTHEVIHDRLGTVQKIEKIEEPDLIMGGSVVFSPSEEFLTKVGIQERVEAVMTLAVSNLPKTFDKVASRFIISTNFQNSQEYKIKTVNGVGQVLGEYVYLVIGLVTK